MNRTLGTVWLILAAMACWPVGVACAQSMPDSAPADGSVATSNESGDSDLSRPVAGVDGQGSGGNNHKLRRTSRDDWLGGYTRTLLALALVAGLVFVARYIVRRFGVSARTAGRARPIEILGRAVVEPRKVLLLVRLGRRVLLIGSSPAGLTALSELTDPAEIDELTSDAGRTHAAGESRRRNQE